MPTMTLHCSPGACSRATMIALEETGAPYDTRVADLMKGEQRRPDYLALNPKGKVPVLVVDGRPLTENVAILNWLADTYPAAKLTPVDPFGRAEALSVVGWLASNVLTSMARIVRPERITDALDAAEGIKDKARDDIRASLAIAEAHMAGRTWWLDDWSVADAYIYYIVNAVQRRGVSAEALPSLVAHSAAMERRPAVQRMLAWERQTLAA